MSALDVDDDFVIYCLRCGKFDEKCLVCSAQTMLCRPPIANSGEFWVKGKRGEVNFGTRRLKTVRQLLDWERDELRMALIVRAIQT